MQVYVFNDEQTAIAAEAYISKIGNMPITGINAKTGEPEPDKQKTERWATPEQRLDSKWVFLRVPAEKLVGVSQEDIDYFWNTFNPCIEEYQDGCFEEVE